MSAFQPILACFLCLFIADIDVRGMHIIDQRNFVCSTESLSLKTSIIQDLAEWKNANPASIPSNPLEVRRFFDFFFDFVFALIFVLKQTDRIRKRSIKFSCYSLYYAEACNNMAWPISAALCLRESGKHSSFQ